MAKLMFALFALFFITVESKCVSRQYIDGGGKKGDPNTKIKPATIKSNQAICSEITDPNDCGLKTKKGKICLWVNEKEPSSLELEGPYIKKVTYLGKNVKKYSSSKEFETAWAEKGETKLPVDGKSSTERGTEITPYIITIGSDDVMYKIEFTDFADFRTYYLDKKSDVTKFLSATSKSVVDGKSKKRPPHMKAGASLLEKSKSTSSLIKHAPLIGKQHTLIPGPRRRRLIGAISLRQVNPLHYSAFGLVELRANGGRPATAGGTIVAHTGEIMGTHRKQIYVLAAGHDLIYPISDDGSVTTRGMLSEYKFYPGFSGSDEERAESSVWSTLDRAWVHVGYTGRAGSVYRDEFDVGLFRFWVASDLPTSAARVNYRFIPGVGFPEPDEYHEDSPRYEMLVYKTGDGMRTMMHQTVQPYRYNKGSDNLLQYDRVPITKGMCGGPLFDEAGFIMAIQVSRRSTPGPTSCDSAAGSSYAGCKGFGTRITVDHAAAFIRILNRDVPHEYYERTRREEKEGDGHDPLKGKVSAATDYDDIYDDERIAKQYVYGVMVDNGNSYQSFVSALTWTLFGMLLSGFLFVACGCGLIVCAIMQRTFSTFLKRAEVYDNMV